MSRSTRALHPLPTAVLLVLALACAGCAARRPPPGRPGAPPSLGVVERFVHAFNQQDVEQMVALTHPEVEWLSVEGASIAVEARGHAALRASLTQYFATTQGVHSGLEAVLATPRFVTTHERVFWEAEGQRKAQAALAVYELAEGLILRVWYFPSVPVPEAG